MGRKLILFSGTVMSSIILALFGGVAYFSDNKSQLLPFIIFAYVIAFGFSLGPVVWLYVSDVLPDIGVVSQQW